MWTTSTANSKVWCNQPVAHHRIDQIKLGGKSDNYALHSNTTSYACQFLSFLLSGTSIVFDMSLTYILVALSAVIVNNALVERLSLHTRICVGKNMQKLSLKIQQWKAPPHFLLARYITLIYRLQYHSISCFAYIGYLFALGPLVFVSVCDVWLELFDTQQSYAVTLAAIAIVAFGCTGTFIQAIVFYLAYIVFLWSETLSIVHCPLQCSSPVFMVTLGCCPRGTHRAWWLERVSWTSITAWMKLQSLY